MKINHRHFKLALAAMSILAQAPSAHAFTAILPRVTPGIMSQPTIRIPGLFNPNSPIKAPSPLTPLSVAPQFILAPAAPSLVISLPVAAAVATPVIAPAPIINQGQSKVILPGLFNPKSPIKLPGSNKKALNLNALFDGAKDSQPTPVPVGEHKEEPAELPAATEKSDSHLTLPEWDLAQEIGI